MQYTGNTLTVDIYNFPVVYVSILPSLGKHGIACAQLQHFLEEERNLICPFSYLCFFDL